MALIQLLKKLSKTSLVGVFLKRAPTSLVPNLPEICGLGRDTPDDYIHIFSLFSYFSCIFLYFLVFFILLLSTSLYLHFQIPKNTCLIQEDLFYGFSN